MSDNVGLFENVFLICVCILVVLVPSAMIASSMPLEFPLGRVLFGFASTIAVVGGIVLYLMKF